jgi:hypothetical protein
MTMVLITVTMMGMCTNICCVDADVSDPSDPYGGVAELFLSEKLNKHLTTDTNTEARSSNNFKVINVTETDRRLLSLLLLITGYVVK